MTPLESIYPVGIGGWGIALRVARLATHAGGLVVMKRGTVTVRMTSYGALVTPRTTRHRTSLPASGSSCTIRHGLE